MWDILIGSLLVVIAAATPVLVARRRVFLNPATYVLLIVFWSPVGKSLYVWLLRPGPNAAGHDPLYVSASSPDFISVGIWMVWAGLFAYACGFVSVGRHVAGFAAVPRSFGLPPRALSRRRLMLLTLVTLVSFAVYLGASGTDLLSWPLSTKRFDPRVIGVASRFEYLPYYFFKFALTSVSLAYAAAFFLVHPHRGPDRFANRFLFGVIFVFGLGLTHFASLRMFVPLALLQIGILVYYERARRWVPFLGAFALLTAASVVGITFVDRAIPPPARLTTDIPPATSLDARSDAEEPNARVGSAGSSGPRASDDSRTTPLLDTNDGERGRRVLGGLTPPVGTLKRLTSAAFSGRYFMDVAKLAHIASYFPSERDYLSIPGLVGVVGDGDDRAAPEEIIPGSLDRYLAREVFQEPDNSVPAGYLGELYISFGWLGIVGGFGLLGVFHRGLFHYLTERVLPPQFAACLVLLIPTTTIVLLNSGLVSAVARAVIDLGILLFVFPPPDLVGPFRRRLARASGASSLRA